MDDDAKTLMIDEAKAIFARLPIFKLWGLYIYTKAGLAEQALKEAPSTEPFFEELSGGDKKMYDFVFEVLKAETKKRFTQVT